MDFRQLIQLVLKLNAMNKQYASTGIPGIGIRQFAHTPENVAVPQSQTLETQIGNPLLFANQIQRPQGTSYGLESDIIRRVLLELMLKKDGGATIGIPGKSISIDKKGIKILKGDQ